MDAAYIEQEQQHKQLLFVFLKLISSHSLSTVLNLTLNIDNLIRPPSFRFLNDLNEISDVDDSMKFAYNCKSVIYGERSVDSSTTDKVKQFSTDCNKIKVHLYFSYQMVWLQNELLTHNFYNCKREVNESAPLLPVLRRAERVIGGWLLLLLVRD